MWDRLSQPWHNAVPPRMVSGLMAVVALAFTAKLALFSYTANARWSIDPGKPFFVEHWCPLGWIEAIDRARRGQDVYATPERREPIAASDPDPFLYSPPFLLAPALMLALTRDSALLHSGWFAFQVVTTLAAFVATGLFAGGAAGARVLWLIPAIWIAPPFLMGLQIGNLHASVFAAAIVGALLMRSSWWLAGSGLLAVAIAAKLFPAVLLVYFGAQRQWKTVAACVLWLASLTVLATLLFGPRIATDFLGALPVIQDGASVAELTENRDLAPSNHSVYGVTRKLAAIGIAQFTPHRGQLVQTVYGGVIFVLALVLGLRAHRRAPEASDRLANVIVWLALLNLASFRSPFLPDAYAFVGSVWLCTLLLARAEVLAWRPLALFAVGWAVMFPIWGGRSTPPEPFVLIVVFSLVAQVGVLALNLHSARS